MFKKLRRRLSLTSSVLASTSRAWRGSMQRNRHAGGFDDHVTLELYEFEGCPYCRLVRESISELQLDVLIYPCPQGGERFRPLAHELAGGETSFPFLVDQANGISMNESADINAYLWETFAKRPAPRRTLLAVPTSILASAARAGKGSRARPSHAPERALELFSFESSPYCRLVRELLCELELPYILRSMAKEQVSDIGMANMRLNMGDYEPVEGGRREQLEELGGKIQVPYLIDPNTDTALYESGHIMKYLKHTYAL